MFIGTGQMERKHRLLSCVQSLGSNEVGPADAAWLARCLPGTHKAPRLYPHDHMSWVCGTYL